MKKNYVLDTNVLLHDPFAIFKFEDNALILPIYVIEEIDQFKRESNERGRNARTVSRLLDGERAKKGSLADGVPIGDGGSLRVHVPDKRPKLEIALNPNSGDHAILQTAIELRDASPEMPTIFVTMDVNLRIRADALGLVTEAYENQAVDAERLESGIVEVVVSAAELDVFFEKLAIKPPEGAQLHANVSVVLRDDTAPRPRSALGRFNLESGEIRALKTPRDGVVGVRARNKEQSFALDLLLDDNVKLVTILGKAGTGKTLLALAAGLKRTIEDGSYSRLLVSRPVMPLGRDLGFLPGDVNEKLNPWMQPIYDNLEFLLAAGGGKRRGIRGYDDLFQSGQVQVEPLTYIRGRSLPQQYVIVDEAQNLTPHELKTVVTRCGEGTKIILTGDPFQIDNPYVDSATNGLSVTADRLRGEGIVGHILLSKGERSELANIAANKL
ncbi:MAG TPA: PhoH family protein [Polyangiaceae bacterium]|nr:PhoH family protein [Polyangiaceae bacterium]